MANQTAPTQAEIEQLSPEDQASYKKLLAASKGFYTIGENGKKAAVEEDPSYKPLMGQASKAVRALMGRHKDVAASAIESEIKRNRDNPDRKTRSSSNAADRGAAVADTEIQQVGSEAELIKVARNKKKFMKDFPTSTDIAEVKERVVLASQGREKVTDADGTTRVVGGTKQTVTTDVPVRKGAKKTKKVTKTTPTGEAGKESPVLPIEANIRKSADSKFSDATDLAKDLGENSALGNTIPMIQKGTGFLPSRERADRRLKSEVDSGNIRIARPGEEGHSGKSSIPEIHQEDLAKHIEIFGTKGYSLINDPNHKNADKYGRVGPGGRTPNAKDYVSHILYMEGWGDTPDEELAPTNMQDGPQMDDSDLPMAQRSDNPATTDTSVGTWTGATESSDPFGNANERQQEDMKNLRTYALQGSEIINPPTPNPVSEALAEEGQTLSDEQRALSEKELDKVAPEDRERIRRAGALSSQFDLNALRLRSGEKSRGAPEPVYKDRTFFTKRTTVRKNVPNIDPVTGLQRLNSSGRKMWRKGVSQDVDKDTRGADNEGYNTVRPNSTLTGNNTIGNNAAEEEIVNSEAASDLQLLSVNKGKVNAFEKNNPTLTEDKVNAAQLNLEELKSKDRTGFSKDDHDDLDAQLSEAELNLKTITAARTAGLGSAGLRNESPDRIGRTSNDIGLDAKAVVAAPAGSTLKGQSTGKGKPKRTILRRPTSFVKENNIVLQEMAQDASERSMAVPAYYVQGSDYRVGAGSANLTAEGSEALPAGIKAQLGKLETNSADPLDDVLNFQPSVKVDPETSELTEPGVLRQMKATSKGIIATGKTTQEVGQDIINDSGLPAGLAAIAAASVEPAARQRIAENAAGRKAPLLSRGQFDERQIAAGKMSTETAEEHKLTDEYDRIAHEEEGQRLLDHVTALNERRPHVEQSLQDYTELMRAKKTAERDMHTMLNSDDPLNQHPMAIDKKTGLINPRYNKLGVLSSNATEKEKQLHRATVKTHKLAIDRAGKAAMKEHIAKLEGQAGLQRDARGATVTDAEGSPQPMSLEDSVNDEVDIDTRVHVLKALHKSITNPIASAPKTYEREQIAFNKVATKPVGTPETHPDNFVSAEQLAGHKQDLDFAKSERGRISEQIGRAREMGDIRENADYDAAREEQGQNEGRIKQLESHISRVESSPSEFEGHYVNPRGTTTTSVEDHPTERVLQQGPSTPKAGTENVRMRGGPSQRGFYGRASVPKKVPVLQQKQMPVFATPPSEETVEEPIFKMQEVKRYNADGKHIGTDKIHVRDEAGNKVPELGEGGKPATRTVPKTPAVVARDSETGEVITAPTGSAEVFASTGVNAKTLGASLVSDIPGNTYDPKTGKGDYVRVEGLPKVTAELPDSDRRTIANKKNLAGFSPEAVIHLALNGTGRFTPVTPESKVSGLDHVTTGEIEALGNRIDKRDPVTENTPVDREYGDVTIVGDDTSAASSVNRRFNIPELSVKRAALAKLLAGNNQSIVTSGSLSRQKTQGMDLNTKNPTKLSIMRGRLARQDAPQFTDYTGGRTPPAVPGSSPQNYPKPETFFEKDPVPAPAPTGYGSVVPQTAIQRNAEVLRTTPGRSAARVTQASQFAPQVMQGTLNAMGAIFGTGAPSVEVPPAPTMSSVSGIPKASMVPDVPNPRGPVGSRMNPSGNPKDPKIGAGPSYKPTESEVGEVVNSTTDEGPVTNARELGRQRKQHEKLTADRNSAISTVAKQLFDSRATGATIGN